MSHQYGRRRTSLHGIIQRTNPLVTDRAVPTAQVHAPPVGMALLPERLPMLRPGVTDTRQDQNRNITLQGRFSLVDCWTNYLARPPSFRTFDAQVKQFNRMLKSSSSTATTDESTGGVANGLG